VSLLLLYTSVRHLPPTTHQPRGPERPRRPTTSPRRRRAFCNLARAARGAVGRVQGCSRAAYEHERGLCGSRATCAARAAARADSRLSLALDHLDLDDPITLTRTPRSLADPLPPTARRMSAPAPSGERGGFGRGRGGDRRGPRRGPRRGARKDEEKEWCVPLSLSPPSTPRARPDAPARARRVPVTKLGRLVKDGKIKSIEEIYLFSLPVKEYQIIDILLPKLKGASLSLEPRDRRRAS